MQVSLREGNFDRQLAETPIDVEADPACHLPVIIHIDPDAQAENQGTVGMVDKDDVRPGILQHPGYCQSDFQPDRPTA